MNYMKKILVVTGLMLIAACGTSVYAQKYMTRTGKISFDASTPTSPEKIDGKNNEVACLLDTKTGDVVFQLQVKGFKFEKQLMEEHFNEKYMESDRFPKSTFNAKITNLSEINFGKDGTYNATVAGKMNMHGQDKEITATGTITVAGNKIKISAKFKAKLDDFKIVVPNLVADKVAKEALVTVDAELNQK